MNCDTCDMAMRERKATRQKPYRYDLSGLSNVSLVGITMHTCPQCGGEVPVIPRIAELHDVLARSLIQKPTLLNGEEIRFLRKHEGFPAQKFAALLGITPEHLSRVENGHTSNLGTSADRLARAIATIAKDGEAAREVLLQIAEQLAEPQRPVQSPRSYFLKLEQQHWKAAA